MVGFLSIIIGSLDPVEHRPRGAELPRIYILGSAQRTGLGQLLVDAALKEAAAENLSYVWLDVMASADRARRAYAKWGFHELGRKKVGASGKWVEIRRSDQPIAWPLPCPTAHSRKNLFSIINRHACRGLELPLTGDHRNG